MIGAGSLAQKREVDSVERSKFWHQLPRWRSTVRIILDSGMQLMQSAQQYSGNYSSKSCLRTKLTLTGTG